MKSEDKDLADWYSGLTAKDQKTLAKFLEFADKSANPNDFGDELLEAAMEITRSERDEPDSHLS